MAARLKARILFIAGDRVSKIILFGSRARGEARPDSDFDLLILMHAPIGDKRQQLVELYRGLTGCGAVVEPWVMSVDEFEETKSVVGGLAYAAGKEGIVLYENEE